jgi:hypothetical protein
MRTRNFTSRELLTVLGADKDAYAEEILGGRDFHQLLESPEEFEVNFNLPDLMEKLFAAYANEFSSALVLGVRKEIQGCREDLSIIYEARAKSSPAENPSWLSLELSRIARERIKRRDERIVSLAWLFGGKDEDFDTP